MAYFSYDGLNKQGQQVHGEVVADTNALAMEKLRDAGVIVTNLVERKSSAGKKKTKGGKKVTTTEIAVFCKQLAAMLSAGVPLTRSMNTLAKQTENARLADAISDIAEDIEGGTPMSQAFAKFPKIFPDLFIAMVAAGETGGIMEQSLVSLADQLQRQKNLEKNIKSAYSYPRTVGIMAIVILIAMLVFMVPTFKKMMNTSVELNGLSQFIFNASDSLRGEPLKWIFTAAIIIVPIVVFIKSPAGHRLWEAHKLTMPMFGSFITKMVVARFCRTLATLLAGGVTAVDAMKSAGPTSGSDKLAAAVNDAISDVEEGKSLADALDKSGLFPPMVTGMTAIGEEAGTLPEMLDKVAEFFEEDVEITSRNLRAMIEPIALVFVGVLVGGMLIALYVPMLTASTSMGA